MTETRVLARTIAAVVGINATDFDEMVASADPTGKYESWIIQRYSDGGIEHPEDIVSRTKPLLARYDLLKSRKKLAPEHRDINRIKTIGDLQDIIEKFEDVQLISRREARKGEEEEFYRTGQAIVLHDDDDVKVVIPKTKAASCFFGRNTRWCTAATESKNLFEKYANESDLYILLIKKENKRFQFYFGWGGQFKDDLDKSVKPRDIASRYPVLWDIFGDLGIAAKSIAFVRNLSEDVQLAAVIRDVRAIELIPDPSEAVQLAAVTQDGYAIRFIFDPSETLQLAAVNQSPYALLNIMKPFQSVIKLVLQTNRAACAEVERLNKKLVAYTEGSDIDIGARFSVTSGENFRVISRLLGNEIQSTPADNRDGE